MAIVAPSSAAMRECRVGGIGGISACPRSNGLVWQSSDPSWMNNNVRVLNVPRIDDASFDGLQKTGRNVERACDDRASIRHRCRQG